MKKYIGHRSKKGDSYIETVVIVLVATMVIVLIINVFSLIIDEQKMNYFSRELLVAASAFGGLGEDTQERFDELCEEIGITPVICSTGSEFIDGSNEKVQLGKIIKITLTYETYLSGFGVLKIPVKITRSGSGISEKYWK